MSFFGYFRFNGRFISALLNKGTSFFPCMINFSPFIAQRADDQGTILKAKPLRGTCGNVGPFCGSLKKKKGSKRIFLTAKIAQFFKQKLT
jgi:hypothetical protein